MRVVVDANIFLSIVIPDSTTPKAEALLKMWKKTGIELVAPSLFQYEIVASLRKHIYRGNLSQKQANEAFEFVLEQNIVFYLDN